MFFLSCRGNEFDMMSDSLFSGHVCILTRRETLRRVQEFSVKDEDEDSESDHEDEDDEDVEIGNNFDQDDNNQN